MFGPSREPEAVEFAQWADDSARFRAFAETYRDKIRKKLTTAQDPDARRSVWAELGVAYLLARERRLSVEYETYGLGARRGPDFTVRFREHVLSNVEVTSVLGPVPEPETNRLFGTICEKLGQLPAGIINVLAVVTPAPVYRVEDVAHVMRTAAARMTPEEERSVIQRGFRSAHDFRQQAQRLSAVWLRWGHAAEHRGGLWQNPGARHPLPADLARLLAVDQNAP